MFVIPMFAAYLVTGIFGAVISEYILTMPQLGVGATPGEIWSWFSTYLIGLFIILFAFAILSWIVGTIADGIVVKCASDSVEKRDPNLGRAFDFTVTKLPSLLVAALVSGLLIILGLIVLIIPGIILAIMFSLLVPAIMIENVGAFEGISRSRRLVDNRWLKTFVFLLIVGLIVGIASLIGSLIGLPFVPFGWLITIIIGTLVGPIVPIALTVYYYSMLAKERQRIPPPPPPPF